MQPVFLVLEEALEIHRRQIAEFGGADGLRDVGLLESALAMPPAGAGAEYFHKDLFEMAGAYLFHLTKNHPFVDGNKRTALACALTFLQMNAVKIHAPDTASADVTVAVAEGRLGKEAIAAFFRRHARRRAGPAGRA